MNDNDEVTVRLHGSLDFKLSENLKIENTLRYVR